MTGEIESHWGDAVILATGGFVNVFYLSTNAMGCSATAIWKATKKGAFMANPCYTQIHPTCIPQHGDKQSKLTLMSESLRNDGRVWVPKKAEDCDKHPSEILIVIVTTTWSVNIHLSVTWLRVISLHVRQKSSVTMAVALVKLNVVFSSISSHQLIVSVSR